MGKFASNVRDVETNNDNVNCIVGRYIAAEFDADDTAEFVRLMKGRRWQVITTMTGLQGASMRRHALGTCCCPDDVAAKGVNRG